MNWKKPINWKQYCQEIFQADVSTVEDKILESGDYEMEEIQDFRKATYIIFAIAFEPERHPTESVKTLAKAEEEAKKKFPNYYVEISGNYFNSAGTELSACVDYIGEGLVPYSLNFD